MASDKMITVNEKRLKYAREYYGLSTSEVSEKTKIPIDKIEKFENGEDHPTYPQLEKLSEMYNQSMIFFFITDDPEDLSKDRMSVYFRSVETIKHKPINFKQKMLIEKADCFTLNLKEIYCNENRPIFKDLLPFPQMNTSAFSQWLREKSEISIESQIENFKKPEQLLEAFREKFYNIGIYVFKDSFQDNDISGLCLPDDNFPVVLLNNKMNFSRQLFTLFHEIYHIFSNNIDVDFNSIRSEKECDEFASSFLIPNSHFSDLIKNMDISECEDKKVIEEFANIYHVSLEAIAYRLLSLKKISNPFFKTLYNEISKKYPREASPSTSGNYYNTKISYLGKSYLNTVFNKYYSGEFGPIEVGVYAQIKSSHISDLAKNFYKGDLV